MELGVFILFVWILFGIAAGIVLANKGRSGCGGFLLGFLLGPIGLVIALVMRADQAALDQEELSAGRARRCPSCAEIVRAEALKCKHCGADLPPEDPEEIRIRRRAATGEKALLIIVGTVIVLAIVGALN